MDTSEKIVEKKGTIRLKQGFAKMCKGGVVMDVVNAKQAKIAESSGAVAVMALHEVPADIRKSGGIARMAGVEKIKEIMDAVTIPVMAKSRIGHVYECKILEALSVDMIDESEVLSPVDTVHINKEKFTIPFVCGAKNLGEALRRINEGAAMIRTKGEPGTGDVSEAIRHVKEIKKEIEELGDMGELELEKKAEEFKVSLELVKSVKKLKRLPVVNFAAGGIATPADAALMMQMGCDGIFVGSGIFKSDNPTAFAKAIVDATFNFKDPKKVLNVSYNLGEPMKGIGNLEKNDMMQNRSE